MPADPITINDNGAWCWFQDERALVDPVTNTLLAGSVAAPDGPGGESRGGNIEIAVLDLATGQSTVHVLHQRLEPDDHNAPALLIRPDGRYLAMYAKHKTDNFSRWRISTRPHDASEWGPEECFDWTELAAGRGATYSNLHRLDAESRVYNFVRAINDDPTMMVSEDDGSSWSYGGKLFTRPKIGYVNGYTRYVGNGTDRIDLITTDHHPRDFNNSIYHGFIRDNALHDGQGQVVSKPLLGSPASTRAPSPRFSRQAPNSAGTSSPTAGPSTSAARAPSWPPSSAAGLTTSTAPSGGSRRSTSMTTACSTPASTGCAGSCTISQRPARPCSPTNRTTPGWVRWTPTTWTGCTSPLRPIPGPAMPPHITSSTPAGPGTAAPRGSGRQ
ncbi:BNR-4 repeat-containing protein [Arthrobacter sp. FW306-05-C]|uniref:BNR-4 repeat-containing protein n=1 Tax=unclassified Arthrobacter TaxID=235627 RepID=UPI001EEFA515|nr:MULTISPECIES: BNR-4 repeat-containing protein [unclassified Arthrobacter]UKA68621.1 BNR-4 repeat-containing protein [Arthrobacter sp. FW306-05-C]UKA77255.1 BNR-4 repeat-containing protein [Arthrobacter sp. FW306-07-I]